MNTDMETDLDTDSDLTMKCKNGQEQFKESVSWDWDRLLVLWMDRALFGDEPLVILKLSEASWFSTLNFTFFRSIAQRLPFCVLLEKPFGICVRGCWQPSGKNLLQGVREYWQPYGECVIRCPMVLTTLWQIPQRILATFANSTY
jgi:hypothetical protein